MLSEKDLEKLRTKSLKRPLLYSFLAHLGSVTAKLQAASQTENPGLYLYQNDLRTPLFMLESLCRILRDTHDKKFDALYVLFKEQEDQLGEIDYFDSMQKQSAAANLPQPFTAWFTKNYDKALTNFNRLLRKRGWFDEPERSPLAKIFRLLVATDFNKVKKETKVVAKFLAEQATKLQKDILDNEFNFKELEEGLHEFRRNLRWLSIYPAALAGLAELSEEEKLPELREYCTAEIVSSKYVRLPENETWKKKIKIPAPVFYSISWLVAYTGTVKDKGQFFEAVETAFHNTEKKKAKFQPAKYAIEPFDIKTESKAISKTIERFFKRDRVMKYLIKSLEGQTK